MHEHPEIFLIAALIFSYGLVSKASEKLPITGPLIFLGIGILFALFFENTFKMALDGPSVQIIAEFTLIIILFVDASEIRFAGIRKRLQGLPLRLLGLGLPLTIILGTLLGSILLPYEDFWVIFLLALILSPTDAALGQAVVKSPLVPKMIKESISIESGLNDGIVFPLVIVTIGLLSGGVTLHAGDHDFLIFMAKQLTLGPLAGILIGWGGGKLIDFVVGKKWMSPTFQSLSAISLALLAYGGAEAFHGNGFIAAFFAGLFLGVKTIAVRERIQTFAEAEGQLLTLYIFLLFGLVGVPYMLPHLSIEVITYSVLSLTFIRMVPVYISLTRTNLDFYSKVFIGWFGPRGIASILYLLIAIGSLQTTGYEKIISIIILTVTLSTLLHGISAVPMSKIFKTKGS